MQGTDKLGYGRRLFSRGTLIAFMSDGQISESTTVNRTSRSDLLVLKTGP